MFCFFISIPCSIPSTSSLGTCLVARICRNFDSEILPVSFTSKVLHVIIEEFIIRHLKLFCFRLQQKSHRQQWRIPLSIKDKEYFKTYMFDCKLEHGKKIVFVRWLSSLHGNQLGLWDCDIATMKLWFFSKLWLCKNETVKQMIKRGGDITLRNSLKERLWSVVSALTGSTKARITSSFFIQPFNCQTCIECSF